MNYLKPLFSIEQTRQIEKYLIAEKKVTEFQLMQKAGKAVFEILQKNIKDKQQSIFVLCGSGNNGGDGYIVATLAAKEKLKVTCMQIGNHTKQTETSLLAKNFAIKNKVKIINYNEDIKFNETNIIIDAILGIGIKNNVREEYLQIINKVNKSNSFVIAVDNPSGLNCNNGEILGNAIKANITVTFLTRKQGLFLKYGKRYSGHIKFSDLETNYNDFLNTIKPQYNILESCDIPKIIPPRKIDSHKRNHGDILIIGGDFGMAGAIIMTAMAACKSGAGKVTVLTKEEHMTPLLSKLPNVMTAHYNNNQDLLNITKDKTLIVIGPGLGKSAWSKKLFNFFMNLPLPKIIDADAINILSQSNKKYNLTNSVITPHPKEAGRLLKITHEQIQQDRPLAIKKLYDKYNATIVLKGANSLIMSENKQTCLCPYGNPGMAVAGMGDILTGLIAGFASQNIDLYWATIIAVYVHALAADRIATQKGEIGILPTDILKKINKIIFHKENT